MITQLSRDTNERVCLHRRIPIERASFLFAIQLDWRKPESDNRVAEQLIAWINTLPATAYILRSNFVNDHNNKAVLDRLRYPPTNPDWCIWIAFALDSDAIAFKLRWCDYLNMAG